jgi:hypothetical protein
MNCNNTQSYTYKGINRYGNIKSYNNCFYGNDILINEPQPSRVSMPTYCTANNQCINNNTYTYLNNRGVEPSPYFEKTNEGLYKSKRPDDRLYDTTRDVNMQLDIPPIQVVYDLKQDNIYKSSHYGKNYKNYESINAGQIQYYIDKDIAQPFFSPLYAFPTDSIGYLWKDPMEMTKPQFEKKFDTKRYTRTGMLSSIEDTTKHRDDIIARQQRNHNERRYDLVHGR